MKKNNIFIKLTLSILLTCFSISPLKPLNFIRIEKIENLKRKFFRSSTDQEIKLTKYMRKKLDEIPKDNTTIKGEKFLSDVSLFFKQNYKEYTSILEEFDTQVKQELDKLKERFDGNDKSPEYLKAYLEIRKDVDEYRDDFVRSYRRSSDYCFLIIIHNISPHMYHTKINKKEQLIKNIVITTLITVPATAVGLYFYIKSKNQELKNDLEKIKNQKRSINSEEIEVLIQKRKSLTQTYLPNWLKSLFFINYDWKQLSEL